jgi:PAS domain S-box-containing protein
MFRLIRYFSIASLALIIVAAGLLGAWYRHIAVGNLLQVGERNNVLLASVLSNALQRHFEPLLEEGAAKTADPATHGGNLAGLRAALMHHARGLSIVKVKIYNREGMTVFSSDASQIGEDKRGNAGFQRALTGEPASEMTRRDTFSAFEQTVENRDLISSYVPVRRGQTGAVYAVFEIYDDVTPLLAQIGELQKRIIAGVVTILLCMYGVLFLIVRRADRILHEQHTDRLRLAVDAAGMTHWEWDVASDQTRWGERHEQLLGPLPPGASRYPDFRDMVHAQDRERFLNAGRATLNEGAPYEVEFRFIRTDGRMCWLRHTGKAVRGADGRVERLLGVTQDVTARHDMARELLETQQRSDALIESIPAQAWMKDREGRFIAVNRAWRQRFGLASDDVIGRKADAIFPQSLADKREREELLAIQSRSEQRFEQHFEIDGEARWSETIETPIFDDHGEVSGTVGMSFDTTARKQAETALREMNENLEKLVTARTQDLRASERRFRQVAQAASGYLWDLDREQRYTYVSDRAESLFGYTPAEMLGRKPAEFMPPGEHERVNEWLRQNTQPDGSFRNLEHRSIAKSGAIFWQSVSTVPLVDDNGVVAGTRGSAVDITERKLTELALQESEIQLQGILGSTADGILAVDHQGRVIRTNRRFAQLWRIPQYLLDSRDEQSLLNFVVGQLADPVAFLQRVRDLYRSDAEDTDTIDFNDGRVFERFTAPLILNEAVVGRVWSFRDITHRRRAEMARAQLEEQLRESQKMEAIGTLAGGIAHDFNNILPAIFGNLELARQDLPPGHSALDSLNEIYRASSRANNLVRQILTFSRRQVTDKRVINLAEVSAESIQLMRAAMPAVVEIDAQLSESLPPVLADATQIHQVMDGAPGRIEIRVEAAALDVPAAAAAGLTAGHYVRVAVSDNGKGMDEAVRARIFEPFFTTKPMGQGTGLGLSVVHTIVKNHGGGIVVDSQPGKGTRVDLYFPCALDVALADALPPEVPAAAMVMPVPTRKRVLFVDDDEALVRVMTRLLERAGCDVSAHVAGERALAAFRAARAGFDLAVTDFNMPLMSGLDVARALLAERSDLPVIITSGYVTDELLTEAARIGVMKVVGKSDSTANLLAQITQALAS